MDRPSMQHEHVVTIPPATDASSIVSSSATTVGFQSLNLPSVIPHESVPTGMSTSGTANTQGRSPTPRRQSHLWDNLCSWRAFDYCSISIQIILLVVFLSLFRDEHPHMALQIWAFGHGAVCLVCLPLIYYSHKCSIDDLVFQGLEHDESETCRHQRSRKILRCLTRFVDGFFKLWFLIGVGIVGGHWTSNGDSHLSKLCTALLILNFGRFALPWMVNYLLQYCCDCIEWPPRAEANVISALPTYNFHARVFDLEANEDSVRNSPEIGDSRVQGATTAAAVVECCVCLDPYEEGVKLKLLPCTHHFHAKCIDRWLKINGSCPICKNEVYISNIEHNMN